MIINYEDLKNIRKRHVKEKLVFCSGTFDMLHAGHVLFLEDCKKLGDVLVVTVGDDEIVKRKSPDRPIINEYMRLKMLDSLRVVDYCFIHKNVKDGEPLNFFMEEIFPFLQPDIWVVNQDATEIPYRQELARKYGIEFYILDRECPPEYNQVSTTNIIKKIRGDS